MRPMNSHKLETCSLLLLLPSSVVVIHPTCPMYMQPNLSNTLAMPESDRIDDPIHRPLHKRPEGRTEIHNRRRTNSVIVSQGHHAALDHGRSFGLDESLEHGAFKILHQHAAERTGWNLYPVNLVDAVKESEADNLEFRGVGWVMVRRVGGNGLHTCLVDEVIPKRH